MSVIRKEDWVELLHKFLLDRAAVPFAWGSNDCALFAADAIEAITGTDIAEPFRGEKGVPAYINEAQAFTLIGIVCAGMDSSKAGAESTVADAAECCADRFGLVEYKHPLLAKRGDLVVLQDAGRLIAGVIHLNGRDVAVVGESGLKRIPMTAVQRAWAV